MNLDQKIQTIVEASKAAAEFLPPVVSLRCGDSVACNRLPWTVAPKMLEKLQGAFEAGIEAYNKRQLLAVAANKSDLTPLAGGMTSQMAEQGSLTVDQIGALGENNRKDLLAAESAANDAFKAAMKHIQQAPDVVLDFICACTGQERAFFERREVELQDVLRVFQVCGLVNYEGPIQDFFGGVLARFLPSASAQQSETQPNLEVVAAQ